MVSNDKDQEIPSDLQENARPVDINGKKTQYSLYRLR